MIQVVNYDPTCVICLDRQVLQREPPDFHGRLCTTCGMSLLDHYWGEHPHTCLCYIDGIRHFCAGWSEALDESFED